MVVAERLRLRAPTETCGGSALSQLSEDALGLSTPSPLRLFREHISALFVDSIAPSPLPELPLVRYLSALRLPPRCCRRHHDMNLDTDEREDAERIGLVGAGRSRTGLFAVYPSLRRPCTLGAVPAVAAVNAAKPNAV